MSRRVLLPTVPIALALSTGVALAVLPVATAHAADTNCPSAEGAYAGGTGTIGDPFLVSTPGQLQRLRDRSADWSKAVRLTADIDMSSGGTDCIWRTTLGNPNIANWTGTFDGDGHVVSGLDIEVTGNFVGFFGYLSNNAVVRDFGFTGDVRATASGVDFVQVGAGALAGWTLTSQIVRSFTTGDVTVNISAAADINSGSATANPIVGGLVGTSQGTVTDSYATGDVIITASAAAMNTGMAVVNTAVGGLLGTAQAGSSIVTDSYSTGSVTTAPSAVGGIGRVVAERIGGSIGEFGTQYASATGVVWDTTASGQATGIGLGTSAGVTGQTSSQMTTYSTFTNLNWDIFDGYSANQDWNLCPALNDGRPVLSRFATSATCYPPPLVPAFSGAQSTPDGFTVAVTNYSASWTWTPTVSAGSATVGTPSGSVLPITVTGLQPGGSATVSLTTARSGYLNGTSSVTGQALPPPPPVPSSEPLDVAAVPGDASALVSWSAPASSGSFPVTYYLATSSPGGRTCLTSSLSCTVAGLTNGTAYTFRVQALTGAGWSPSSDPSEAVTPVAVPRLTVTITGAREGKRISVSGSTTGMGMGAILHPWVRLAGQSTYSQGSAEVLVSMDGTFAWSRRAGREASVYMQTPDGSVRSNTVVITGR